MLLTLPAVAEISPQKQFRTPPAAVFAEDSQHVARLSFARAMRGVWKATQNSVWRLQADGRLSLWKHRRSEHLFL